MKSSLQFNEKLTNFLMITLYLSSKAKTVHMLLRPIKLLKKEQFVLCYYDLVPVEGVSIYTQVMLYWTDSPTETTSSSDCMWNWDFHIVLPLFDDINQISFTDFHYLQYLCFSVLLLQLLIFLIGIFSINFQCFVVLSVGVVDFESQCNSIEYSSWIPSMYFDWSDCIILTHENFLDNSNLPLSQIHLASFYQDHIIDIDFHWFFFITKMPLSDNTKYSWTHIFQAACLHLCTFLCCFLQLSVTSSLSR